MITSNPMQLKARIKNLAAQIVLQNYLMERLLERLSLSNYRVNFIIKGGFLIAVMIGLESRSTMDFDTTIKGFALDHESIRTVFEHVCTIKVDDDVTFSVSRIADIREADDYPGIRVSLIASYPPLRVPLSVDVTTGDKITPHEIEYSFPLLFDERTISMMAYNLDTLLAEKLETILSSNIADILEITQKTVENHRNNLREKLELKNKGVNLQIVPNEYGRRRRRGAVNKHRYLRTIAFIGQSL